jgi:cytochrome c556
MLKASTQRRPALFLVVVFGLLSWEAGTAAHEGATGVVKERMMIMESMSDSMKALAKLAKGEREWDAQAVQDHITGLSKHASADIGGLFPEDSAMPPSEAEPSIWSDWDEFQSLWLEFREAADSASQSNVKDPDALISQVQTLAKTCRSCHDEFKSD